MNRLAFGRWVLVIWMLIPSLQYSSIGISHLRPPFWIASLVLLKLAGSRFDLYWSSSQCARSGLVLFFLPIAVWRAIGLIWSEIPLAVALPIYFDFIFVSLVLLLVVPRLFSVTEWLRSFVVLMTFVFLASVLLQPVIPAVKINVAGWDKGSSWLFSHPNIAAMYPLSIFMGLLLLLIVDGVKKKWLIFLGAVVALVSILPTNARTAEMCAGLAVLLFLIGRISKGLWQKGSVSFLVLRRSVVLCSMLVVSGAIYFLVFDYFSLTDLDDFSTGRLFFAISLIDTVEDIYLGVGFLPPGDNLLFEKEDYGAGIDGLYVNVVYTDGLLGIVLLGAFMLKLFVVFSKGTSGVFPYFTILLVCALVFGITESHFWLLPGPLTMLVVGLGAILSVKQDFLPRKQRVFVSG